jgi:hypothetical protein
MAAAKDDRKRFLIVGDSRQLLFLLPSEAGDGVRRMVLRKYAEKGSPPTFRL